MLLDDLAARLVAQGVGALGVNIFLSSASIIPPGPGPYLTLSETGGVAPTRIQNKPNAAATVRPTVQVLVRAGRIAGIQEAYPAARTMSTSAYLALDSINGLTINGIVYVSVNVRQEPTDMGLDATGQRVQVVFNVDIEKQPS